MPTETFAPVGYLNPALTGFASHPVLKTYHNAVYIFMEQKIRGYMKFPSFNEWLLVKEGKKGKSLGNRQAMNDFLSGKTDKIKLPSAPVALGHQAHQSGTGAWKSKKAYDRKKDWRKDQE
jgi:hypothetical protein